MRLRSTGPIGLAWIVLACGLQLGGCPTPATTAPVLDENTTRVRIETTLGSFVIELNRAAAPLTAQNFIDYAAEGFYDGTIFHEVIPGLRIAGGSLLPNLTEKPPTRDPIANESDNGLLNLAGTVAMEFAEDPNSAQTQFYINLVDNPGLDPADGAPGRTVFATVVEGQTVLNLMADSETWSVSGFIGVPVDPIIILSVTPADETATLDPAAQELLNRLGYAAAYGARNVVVTILSYFISGS